MLTRVCHLGPAGAFQREWVVPRLRRGQPRHVWSPVYVEDNLGTPRNLSREPSRLVSSRLVSSRPLCSAVPPSICPRWRALAQSSRPLCSAAWTRIRARSVASVRLATVAPRNHVHFAWPCNHRHTWPCRYRACWALNQVPRCSASPIVCGHGRVRGYRTAGVMSAGILLANPTEAIIWRGQGAPQTPLYSPAHPHPALRPAVRERIACGAHHTHAIPRVWCVCVAMRCRRRVHLPAALRCSPSTILLPSPTPVVQRVFLRH